MSLWDVTPFVDLSLLFVTIRWSSNVQGLRARLTEAGFELTSSAGAWVNVRHPSAPAAPGTLTESCRFESSLRVVFDPHELPEHAWELLHEEFLSLWEAAIGRVTVSLGPPEFVGGPGDPGMPDDEDAIRLASWTGLGRRLSIQYRHEDRELPMRLVLVISPSE